jgi:hypothetical protein
MTKIDIRYADKNFLEAMALSLARDIDRGETDKRPLLEQVLAQIPNAADYVIDHRQSGYRR